MKITQFLRYACPMKDHSSGVIRFQAPNKNRDQETENSIKGAKDSLKKSKPSRPSYKFVGPSAPSENDKVFFKRPEFEAILNLYGKMVASGHWKDYAMDSSPVDASFAIYQHAHDRPLYIIRKTPKLATRQGVYSLISAQGKILKRGSDLKRLLSYFDKAMIKLVR